MKTADGTYTISLLSVFMQTNTGVGWRLRPSIPRPSIPVSPVRRLQRTVGSSGVEAASATLPLNIAPSHDGVIRQV